MQKTTQQTQKGAKRLIKAKGQIENKLFTLIRVHPVNKGQHRQRFIICTPQSTSKNFAERIF